MSMRRALVIVVLAGAVGLPEEWASAQYPGTRPVGPVPGIGAASVASLFSVRQYGAVGDGTTKDTRAIQSTIDAAAAGGGGTVSFPAGLYLSGTILLKSKVTILLEPGATLLGSTDLADFPCLEPAFRSYTDNYTCRSLLYGEDLHDVGVVGSGTIDGQGAAFKDRQYKVRPYVLRLISCRNVRVEGITFRNSPMWMQHYLACDGVVIRGLSVYSHGNHNNDMIDIDCCRNVRVSDCVGDTDDDALTLKSTADRACENITVTNCVLSSNCNAIKLGTETNGGFKNVAISNCAIHPSAGEKAVPRAASGLAGIALEIVDGGTLDGVTISNVTIQGTRAPLFLRLGNRARPFLRDGTKPDVGAFRNVVISNIVATGAGRTGCAIAGLPGHPIENVSLSNIRITCEGGGTREEAAATVPEKPDAYPECTMFGILPAYGFYCRHVNGLTLSNVSVQRTRADLRPAIVCDDVTDLEMDGVRGQAAAGGSPVIVLNDVRGALLRGCQAPAETGIFLRLAGSTERVSVLSSDLSAARTPFEFSETTPRTVLHQSANRLPD